MSKRSHKKEKMVIAQKPNPPLWVAIGFFMLRFVPLQNFDLISSWGVAVSLLYWSYLEIVSGVNLFRKLLGVVVFSYSFVRVIQFVLPFFGSKF